MNKSVRVVVSIMMASALLLSSVAEAARLGGGRSVGMQRTPAPRQSVPPTTQSVPPQQSTMPPQAGQQQRSGPGWGTVAAGAALGGAAGYMLGNNQNNTVAPGQNPNGLQPGQQRPGFPWGWILLLGGVALVGAWWMSRRNAPRAAAVPGASAGFNQSQNAFGTERKVYRLGESSIPALNTPITRLPDGTETEAFLRQVRASFAHIQSLNSPEQLEEIRRYLTPDFFTALQGEITANRDVAEFADLSAELVAAVSEAGQMIASVRFSGRVSESLHAPMVPFAEVWHFVRPMTDPRWVLAGIQQD